MQNESYAAITLLIASTAVSLAYCMVKVLAQLEQSRCSEINTRCCTISRDLSEAALQVAVAHPNGSDPAV